MVHTEKNVVFDAAKVALEEANGRTITSGEIAAVVRLEEPLVCGILVELGADFLNVKQQGDTVTVYGVEKEP